MSQKKLRVLLWLCTLLLLAGGALLLRGGSSPAEERLVPQVTPTATPAVRELRFATDTLPGPAELAAYPELERLDITDCEQVDPALYEAISRAVPAN